MKSLRKHSKNTTSGKNERSIFHIENRATRSLYLIRLIEEWRKNNNYIIGAVLMDLSKGFDCISHDLVITKLPAMDLTKISYATFIHTYKIENSVSV